MSEREPTDSQTGRQTDMARCRRHFSKNNQDSQESRSPFELPIGTATSYYWLTDGPTDWLEAARSGISECENDNIYGFSMSGTHTNTYTCKMMSTLAYYCCTIIISFHNSCTSMSALLSVCLSVCCVCKEKSSIIPSTDDSKALQAPASDVAGMSTMTVS